MKAGGKLSAGTTTMSKLAAKTKEMLAKPVPYSIKVIQSDGTVTTAKTIRDLPNEYRAVVQEAYRQNLALPANLTIEINNSGKPIPILSGEKVVDAAGVYYSGSKRIFIQNRDSSNFFSRPRNLTLAHEFGHANHDKLFPGSMKTWSRERQEEWAEEIARQLTGG